MLKEYIQIDDVVYSVLDAIDFKGIEICVVLEVREEGKKNA